VGNVIDLPDIAIAISGFLRPKLLLDNLNNCRNLFPNSPIYVLIDRYDQDDENLMKLNRDSMKIVQAYKDGVQLIFEPTENLGIKCVANELISHCLNRHEYVIFLEDDLFLTDNCYEEIVLACKLLDDNVRFAFATLYSLFSHNSSTEIWLSTKWPRMWGVLLRRENFRNFLEFKNSIPSDRFQLLATCRNKLILSEFERVWRWKFTKARESKHAFDTSLMEILWASPFRVLTPVNSLTTDRGGGLNSFSSRYGRRRRSHRIRRSNTNNVGYCETCEKIRFMEFSSRKLKSLSLLSKWSVV
jgi:hypothetical protein